MKNKKFVILIILLLLPIVFYYANGIYKKTFLKEKFVDPEEVYANIKPVPDMVHTPDGYIMRGHYLFEINKNRKEGNLPLINSIAVDTINHVSYLYYNSFRNGRLTHECEVRF